MKLTLQCEECDDIITSYSHLRHTMNYCKCGKSAVDLEESYCRYVGKVKIIKREETNN